MHEVVVPSLWSVLILGAICLALIYHAVLYFFSKDRLLIHYMAYLVALAFFALVRSGLVQAWCGKPADDYMLTFLNEPAQIIYLSLYFNFILQSIEVTRAPNSFLFRSWVLIMGTLFAYAIGFFVWRTIGYFETYSFAFIGIRVFIFLLTAIMLYHCFRLRHVTFQFFILLGSGCYFLFGLISFVSNFFVSYDMWIYPPEWLIVGSFVDIIFFSIALSYRFKTSWENVNNDRLMAANELLLVQNELLEKQLALENERRRIAADMHDDLGSGLTKIAYLSQSLPSGEQSGTVWKKINRTASGLVENLSEIIWAMKEDNNSLADLISYVRNYTAEYLETNNLDYSIDSPDAIPNFEIKGEARRHVFLSVKEALHNVVKHSGAKKVQLSIALPDGLQITIADDGKGLDQSKTTGNGMGNMKKRMAAVNGELIVDGSRGTRISFRIPL